MLIYWSFVPCNEPTDITSTSDVAQVDSMKLCWSVCIDGLGQD